MFEPANCPDITIMVYWEGKSYIANLLQPTNKGSEAALGNVMKTTKT